MELPELELSLFGRFELRIGSHAVEIDSGRIRSLLAWMALHPDGPQLRSRVASALWPESGDGQARTNLRNLLHQLRRVVPLIDRYLDTTGPALEWRVGAQVSIDVATFERALAEARAEGMEALEDALALRTGPLMPDCYERWIAPHQARLARMYASGLDSLLERLLETGDYARVLAVSERILEHDDLNERAHCARISSLAATGDRAGALRAWHECESRLAAELGVAPAASTRAAYEATLQLPETEEVHAARAIDARAPAGFDGPFVGRGAELAALKRLWVEAMETRARIVWVTGEPGIGKSRLVQAFVEWLRRQGQVAVHARAWPTQGALAYGPVIGWLRSPPLARVLAAAPAPVRAVLGRLLPELAPGHEAPPPTTLTEAERRQRIHDAVAGLLFSPGAPKTFVIDDLHWSDRETLDVLHTLLGRATGPLLVLATVRTEEVEPEAALDRLGARLTAAALLERIPLEPLGLEDTGRLAATLSSITPTHEEVCALFRETEGNPLFIVETVRSGVPWDRVPVAGEGGVRAPPRIRAVIEGRLALLSRDARTVTRAAAAIGREFTLDLLLRVSDLDETATLRGLDEAWRRRLVRDRGDGRYDFTHDRIREEAYRTTSPVQRRMYHRIIAEALDTMGGPEATADQIALHFDRGGSVAKAIDRYRRAAADAAEVSALDAVRQLIGRALDLQQRLPAGPERDRAELDMRLTLGSVRVALEGYGRSGIIETYTRAHELCARLERPVPPPVLRALGLAALARGDLAEGTRMAGEIEAIAKRGDDPVARVEGAYLAGVMAFWSGDLAKAERSLRRALHSFRTDRRAEHVRLYAQDPEVVCLTRLAWTLWHRGRVTEAFARRDAALAQDAGADPHSLAYALWFTLFIAVDQDDVERIAAQTERLKATATRHRLHYIDAVADAFLGYVQTLRGSVRAGIARMRATLDDPTWQGSEYVLKPQTLLLIARAAAAAGDAHSTRAAAHEALAFLGPGTSFWRVPFEWIDARAVGHEDRSGEHALPAFRRATETARACGSAWIRLRVAMDRAAWCIEHRAGESAHARADLAAALQPYADAPPLPVLGAANILLERLESEDDRWPQRHQP